MVHGPTAKTPFFSLAAALAIAFSSSARAADHEGMDYERWRVEHLFLLVPAQQFVAQFLGTFKEFPPRQKPGSFSVDQVLENLQSGGN